MWPQLSAHDCVTCLCLSFSTQRGLWGHLSVLTFLTNFQFPTLISTSSCNMTDQWQPICSFQTWWLKSRPADILMSGFCQCRAVYVRIRPCGHVYSRTSTSTRWISPCVHYYLFIRQSSHATFQKSMSVYHMWLGLDQLIVWKQLINSPRSPAFSQMSPLHQLNITFPIVKSNIITISTVKNPTTSSSCCSNICHVILSWGNAELPSVIVITLHKSFAKSVDIDLTIMIIIQVQERHSRIPQITHEISHKTGVWIWSIEVTRQ